jgi:hypothetical protein
MYPRLKGRQFVVGSLVGGQQAGCASSASALTYVTPGAVTEPSSLRQVKLNPEAFEDSFLPLQRDTSSLETVELTAVAYLHVKDKGNGMRLP